MADMLSAFDFALPELSTHGVICIGLTIDWEQTAELHAIAIEQTSADEHARAAKFYRAEDSLRHLLGRVLLRKLAGRYGTTKALQEIPCNPWGKPEPVAPPLGCNVTHSGNQVWTAIARSPLVGIDVDAATASFDYNEIAANFHPQELAALKTSADPASALMRCWVRKEAVSKAVGMGLQMPLNSYAVDCGPQAANWLRVAPPGYPQPKKWASVDLPVAPGYFAALAVAGDCNEVTVIDLLDAGERWTSTATAAGAWSVRRTTGLGR